ncbi:MAG: hypothetical protein CMF50_04110 [Legionellales bacterium]|nr:hypothetical protein [Legionellales bacterium]|tara:strand:- start:17622 stop:18608 length:987 start_codon:yes stop_codon:yes gene_type:complete
MITVDETDSPERILHDSLFKRSMENVAVARDFFKAYLPAEILALIKLETLTLIKNEYISKGFLHRHSDVVYRVETSISAEMVILFRTEQQAQSVRLQALRDICYSVLSWEQIAKNCDNLEYLPPIIGLTYYNGRVRYSAPLDLVELFHPDLRQFVAPALLGPTQLIDLHRLPDEELVRQGAASFFQLAMLHSDQQNVTALINGLAECYPHVKAIDDGEYVNSVLDYAMSRFSDSAGKEFRSGLRQLDNVFGGVAMSYLETLREEGRQEGREEGHQEGWHEGHEEGLEEGANKTRYEMAQEMLEVGIDEPLILRLTHLSQAELELIKTH